MAETSSEIHSFGKKLRLVHDSTNELLDDNSANCYLRSSKIFISGLILKSGDLVRTDEGSRVVGTLGA